MAFEFLVLLFATLDSIHSSSVSLRALNSSGSAREYHIAASQRGRLDFVDALG